MKMDRSSSRPWKSLKQSLKELLKRKPVRAQSSRTNSLGSGILRKANTPFETPAHISTASVFPDFGCSQFSLNPTANSKEDHPQQTRNDPVRQSQSLKHSLLPATSLSQFRLHDAYLQYGSVPRHPVYGYVTNPNVTLFSQQASISSIHTIQPYKTVSTLRLRDSRSTLTSLRPPSQQHFQPINQPDQVRKIDVSYHFDADASGIPASTTPQQHHASRQKQLPLTLVDHFRSFCVLDTATPGCPVTATSSELRYIFEIGEQFFLDNQECQGTSIDIVTGYDALGNEITHLVLFSPLIAPSSGRSRFMFASLIDVTRFIEETASLPELDVISEEASIIDDVPTPPSLQNQLRPAVSNELSVEDLLGGCYISDVIPKRKPMESDVWLNLAASEESSRGTPTQVWSKSSLIQEQQTSLSQTSPRTTGSIDNVLEQFIGDLQALYSDFFLLGKSPLGQDMYEICNVSAKVFASKEYIHGHLSKSPMQTIEALSEGLSRTSAFTLPVRWGDRGNRKQLYCNPVYGQQSLTWICFLVDEEMPLLW